MRQLKNKNFDGQKNKKQKKNAFFNKHGKREAGGIGYLIENLV